MAENPEFYQRLTHEQVIRDFEQCDFQSIKVWDKYIPEGAKLVEAYETDKGFVIIGTPKSDDESHNCDEMGCSTLSHVVARIEKPACAVIGHDEGATCNRDGCDGEMALPQVENCSCHISPPCHACTTNRPRCFKCGADAEDGV
jgi:hypothetical protein